MSVGSSGWAAGLLLVIAGIWLLLQTLVGSLPARLVGLGGSSSLGPAPNYAGNQTATEKSTNNTIGSVLNPNPPAAPPVPFLGGLPGTSTFNPTPPSP